MWSLVQRSEVHSMDPETLLADDCSPLELSTQRVTARHDRAGYGVIACRYIAESNVVRPYYRSLEYADLGKKPQVTKRYGEKYMKVTAEYSRR